MAVELYNANRFPEAETICRQVLAAVPNQWDALHVLGLVAHRVGETRSPPVAHPRHGAESEPGGRIEQSRGGLSRARPSGRGRRCYARR